MSKSSRIARLRKKAQQKDALRSCEVTIHGEVFTFRLTLGGEERLREAGLDPLGAIQRLLRRQQELLFSVARSVGKMNGGLSLLKKIDTAPDEASVEEVLGAAAAAEGLMEAVQKVDADATHFSDILTVLLWGLSYEEPALTMEDVRAILDDPADLLDAFRQAQPVISTWVQRRKVSADGAKAASAAEDLEGN